MIPCTTKENKNQSLLIFLSLSPPPLCNFQLEGKFHDMFIKKIRQIYCIDSMIQLFRKAAVSKLFFSFLLICSRQYSCDCMMTSQLTFNNGNVFLLFRLQGDSMELEIWCLEMNEK